MIIETFEHNDNSYEIKTFKTNDGWNIKVFKNGEPLPPESYVSDEVLQDSKLSGLRDFRSEIAEMIKERIVLS